MGKTKRKNKKNKRTRKKRGGDVPEVCLKKYGVRNKKWHSHRPWVLHLMNAMSKGSRKASNISKEDKLKEREKWCGNKEKNDKGYCFPKNGKAWIKGKMKNNPRCTKDGKNDNKDYCLIDLDLSEWHHCTETCGRIKDNETEEFKKIKGNEYKVNCNDVKIKVGDEVVDMKDAPKALKRLEKKIEREKKEAEKKAKEEKERKKRELREKQVQAEIKLREEKKKKDEEHAKQVRENKKKKELQDKKDRMDKCTKDFMEKIETKKNELNLINIGNIQTLEEIDETVKKLAEINQLGQKLMTHFDKCIYEFPSMKGQITAAIKKLGNEIMPLFEKTFKKQEEIMEREKEVRRVEEENNGKPEKCKQYNKSWKPSKSCKLRCPEPETCKDPLCVIPAECKDKGDHPDMKIKRHNNKLPSCPGKICRGSIITGRPADAWTTYEYEGYVLGPKGRTGWPVVYNYNNKFPWFGMFVKERQAATTDEKKFKRWFDKYLTNHETDGKNNGRSNALRSMRDKHDINIPQRLVEYFPRKFDSGRSDWKGGKRKRKTNKKKFRKKGTKKNR